MSLRDYNVREWVKVHKYSVIKCDVPNRTNILLKFQQAQNASGNHGNSAYPFSVKGSGYTSKFVRRHRRRRNVVTLMFHEKFFSAILVLSGKRTVTGEYR